MLKRLMVNDDEDTVCCASDCFMNLIFCFLAVSIQTNVPQPEAAIDSTECQHRLLEHIQKQQSLAMTRLQTIEARVIGEYANCLFSEFSHLSLRSSSKQNCFHLRESISQSTSPSVRLF